MKTLPAVSYGITHRALGMSVIAITLCGACGSKEASNEATKPSNSGKAETPTSTAKTNGTSSSAKATDESDPIRALAKRAAKLPEIAFTPKKMPLGSGELSLSVCALEGGEPLFSDVGVAVTAIGDVAMGSDGNLYVVDVQQNIRRYKVDKGAECKLTLDTSFANGGVLKPELPKGATGGGNTNAGSKLPIVTPWITAGSLDADDKGELFVASDPVYTHGMWRVSTGGKVDYYCNDNGLHGSLSVSRDGTTGFARTGSGVTKRVAFDDTGCKATDWSAQGINNQDDVNDVWLLNDTVFVATDVAKVVHQFDLDGKPKGPSLGRKDASLSDDDNICSAFRVWDTSPGLTVVDYNCRKLVTFNDEGKAIGPAIDISKMLNPSAYLYPTFSGATHVKGGQAYLAMHIERKTADNQSDPDGPINQGFIVRFEGL